MLFSEACLQWLCCDNTNSSSGDLAWLNTMELNTPFLCPEEKCFMVLHHGAVIGLGAVAM